jgi:hypothetical protein
MQLSRKPPQGEGENKAQIVLISGHITVGMVKYCNSVGLDLKLFNLDFVVDPGIDGIG